MLAGIKTGKKKKQQPKDPPFAVSSDAKKLPVNETASASDNASAADQLRQSFAAGIAPRASDAAAPSSGGNSLLRDLERRGKIQSHDGKVNAGGSGEASNSVVFHPPPASTKDEADMTVQELLLHEKSQSEMSLAEQEARTAFRRGKKRRMKAVVGGNVDSDEEEERQLANVRDTSSATKVLARDRSRHVARQDRQDSITAACGWWLESSSFSRHRLLALGNHVSLVMAPPANSLVPGEHLYIVPIPHAPSLTACDETVWAEIRRFQSSLRTLCRAEKKDVIFCETVLPSKGFWQTRLEAIIVPANVCQDAPMYFRSELTQQAEDWGTHQKLMKTDATKDLRASIPKNFSYFYVEYGDGGGGYVQMIESNTFPKDFGVDTIAGMMQMDPIRFRSKPRSTEELERQAILQFLEKWKKFDWTTELDNE